MVLNVKFNYVLTFNDQLHRWLIFKQKSALC